jgi:hypothetical protein
MPYTRPLNGGIRRPNDKRRVRYARDFPDQSGTIIFHADECPVQAATIEAKMSGRVMEIFKPDRMFGRSLKYIPAEFLAGLGEVRESKSQPPIDPASVTIDFENLI